jgi:membrane-associated protease RseP (regulator of RpoE activity)
MTILECPDRTRGEWRFRFFGIPVCVQPLFWLTLLFMGANRETGAALIWVAVCFVSILLHEVGHVVAFRAFGEQAEVVLYSWGGLAKPQRGFRMSSFAQTVISLAGPVAGFCFGLLVVGMAQIAGAKLQLEFHMLVIPSLTASFYPAAGDPAAGAIDYMRFYHWNVLLNDLLFVNIYWGLVNLLPIYPLDGGQAARALFEHHDPARGRRRSLIVSIAAAVVVAAFGLITRSMYLTAMFGILAAGSAQMLEADRPMFRPFTGRR